MIHKIPFPSLLDDLKIWSDEHSKKLFEEKVVRVYTKCIHRNRKDTADKIYAKYHDIVDKGTWQSDFILALKYQLMLKK